MRKKIATLLGTLAIVSLAFVSSAKKVPIGTLEGTVLDGQGKPVPEASVTIQTSDGLHPHATRTDASGHFQFARWETGQYDLRAYSKGVFSEWDKRIMIRSNKTTKITLRLPRNSDEKVVVSN
jgi:uncharacterized GH25 family protein